MPRYIITVVMDTTTPDESAIEKTVDHTLRFSRDVHYKLGGKVHDVEVVKLGKPSEIVKELMRWEEQQ